MDKALCQLCVHPLHYCIRDIIVNTRQPRLIANLGSAICPVVGPWYAAYHGNNSHYDARGVYPYTDIASAQGLRTATADSDNFLSSGTYVEAVINMAAFFIDVYGMR